MYLMGSDSGLNAQCLTPLEGSEWRMHIVQLLVWGICRKFSVRGIAELVGLARNAAEATKLHINAQKLLQTAVRVSYSPRTTRAMAWL